MPKDWTVSPTGTVIEATHKLSTPYVFLRFAKVLRRRCIQFVSNRVSYEREAITKSLHTGTRLNLSNTWRFDTRTLMADSAGHTKTDSTGKKTPKMTPMLEQYQRIKSQYPDAILFYRMGDFYEMFFEDALEAAPLLEVQLTARDKNAENPIPMCGIPHHAAQSYIQKLLAHGKKIAICEQLESPTAGKGVVKRDVIRVVTPALVGDPEIVAEESRHLLVALHETDTKTMEACCLDLFSGDVLLGETRDVQRLEDTLLQWDPKEFLIAPEIRENAWFQRLHKYFGTAAFTERRDYFAKDGAHGAVLRYIQETQKVKGLDYLKEPAALFSSSGMALDSTTISTLEIFKTGKGSWEGPTLFNVLNFTQTPMGRRLLKEWLAAPLFEKNSVEARLDAVDAFIFFRHRF
ncbi:MAG: hypothetical protein KDD51_05220 [Bdellovibrionales bacterium]|nr:hypothetical protein [Bdellovibrionales bacterium]